MSTLYYSACLEDNTPLPDFITYNPYDYTFDIYTDSNDDASTYYIKL